MFDPVSLRDRVLKVFLRTSDSNDRSPSVCIPSTLNPRLRVVAREYYSKHIRLPTPLSFLVSYVRLSLHFNFGTSPFLYFSNRRITEGSRDLQTETISREPQTLRKKTLKFEEKNRTRLQYPT